MFLIIIERLWKSSHKVCTFCAETVKTCAAASEYIFYVSANVWLLLGVFQCFPKERASASKRYQWNDCFCKENVQLPPNIFFYAEHCVAASRNISTTFNECSAASEKILTTASERKKCTS